MMQRSLRWLTLMTLLLTVGGQVLAEETRAPSPEAWVKQQSEQIAEQLRAGDYGQAEQTARGMFDYVVAHVPARQTDLFVDAAFRRRLTTQLADADPSVRERVTPFLLKHEELARTVAFLIVEEEKPGKVLATLDELIEAVGEDLAEYPNLAGAIAVVHDRDLVRRINENTVKAPDPVALYRFFVEHERRMLFGIRQVPAELLVWVVDSTASIEEMEWAVKHYAGDRAVGRRFFDIEYDYAHLRTGQPKEVTQKGFNLPNIREYGGVCADQAYFAVAVGKSIGVPTAYTTARSGQTGHAWVGFLASRGREGFWNFDVGRYDAYQGIKGDVENPQTGKKIPDAYVSLLGEMIGTRTGQRWTAVAMTDAAIRLGQAPDRALDPAEPPRGASASPAAPREPDAETRLELLEKGLRANPGYARAWFVMTDMAEADQMSLAQIKRWAEVLQRLTGRKYPDFTLAVLKPMIASMEEVRDQNQLWEAAYRLVQPRKDLAAEIRVQQGRMWEQAGEMRQAGRAYQDVIRQFADDGPFAVEALKQTERILRETGGGEKVVRLYESTWERCTPPRGMAAAFAQQSNWYNIGMLYADRLEQAGQADRAAEVREQIKQTLGG